MITLLHSLAYFCLLILNNVESLAFKCALSSLQNGNWVKFISGASNQDLPFIKNLSYLYTLAGVDCIDLSADFAVISAANEGIDAAMMKLKQQEKQRPLVMISVNDGEDLHFRKVQFDPNLCPSDCSRPCERVCPALAISSKSTKSGGVDQSKCYGCGRCIPVCPLGLIHAHNYQVSPDAIKSFLASEMVDAIEIHTQLQESDSFGELWRNIGETVLRHSKVLAVSFPDRGEETIPRLLDFQHIISTKINDPMLYNEFKGVQIWQADGRPMSGDIGKGTAHASVQLAKKLLQQTPNTALVPSSIDFLSGQHYVQLAGGVNLYSPVLVEEEGLHKTPGFGGYAFGGFARKQLVQYFEENNLDTLSSLDDHLDFLLQFVRQVVGSVKR